MKNGFRGFSDHEILELLLTLCIPRCDVKGRAKLLLEKFGSIDAVFGAPERELLAVDGIGNISVVAIKVIKALTELRLQYSAERTEVLDNSEKLISFWKARLGSLRVEVFEVAYVNAKLSLLKDGIEELERGVVDRVNIYPRKILEAALNKGASGIILAHNHPSGDSAPSWQDEVVTRKIKYAAECLDIRLIDHIIISKFDTFSFREHGLVL